MKKSLLFVTPLLAISLASCNNAGKTLPEQKGASVVSKEFIQNNWTFEARTGVKLDSFERFGEQELKDKAVVDLSNYEQFAVLQDKNSGDLSLSAIFANKIVGKMKDGTMSTRGNELIGEFAVYQGADEKYYLVDSKGTSLFSCQEKLSWVSFDFDYVDYFATLHLSQDGKDVILYSNLEDVSQKNYALNDVIPAKYGTGYRLDGRGLKGYKMYEHDLDVTIYKDGKKVGSYIKPLSTPTFSVGKYDVFVEQFELPVTAENYSLISFGKKYDVKITRIDLTTCKKSNLELNGFTIVDGVSAQYKDKNGQIAYAKVTVAPLSKDKVVNYEAQRQYIVDADLNLHDDVTNLRSPYALEFNKKIYVVDMYDSEVYDEKLNIIGNYQALNARFMEGVNVFVGSQNGKYGIFNVEGKVVVPFAFDTIDEVYSNGTAFGHKDDKAQSITFSATSGEAYKVSELEKELPVRKTLSLDAMRLYYRIDENNKATLFDCYSGATVKEIANVSSMSNVASSVDLKGLKYNVLVQVENADPAGQEYYMASISFDESMFYLA